MICKHLWLHDLWKYVKFCFLSAPKLWIRRTIVLQQLISLSTVLSQAKDCSKTVDCLWSATRPVQRQYTWRSSVRRQGHLFFYRNPVANLSSFIPVPEHGIFNSVGARPPDSRWGSAPDPFGAPPETPAWKPTAGVWVGGAPRYILAAKPPRALGRSPNRRCPPGPTLATPPVLDLWIGFCSL